MLTGSEMKREAGAAPLPNAVRQAARVPRKLLRDFAEPPPPSFIKPPKFVSSNPFR